MTLPKRISHFPGFPDNLHEFRHSILQPSLTIYYVEQFERPLDATDRVYSTGQGRRIREMLDLQVGSEYLKL